jgi:drug/metabolite transporter (DMT)-like permease
VPPFSIGRVVLWMTGALLSFSAMAVSIHGLAGTLSIFEILTVRSVLALVILLSLAALWPELRAGLRPRRMGLNPLRNGIHFTSQFAWALSITLLPFATVFALEFSMPVWVAILAVIFLGERVTPGRIGVIVLGLIGVLVILRPGLVRYHFLDKCDAAADGPRRQQSLVLPQIRRCSASMAAWRGHRRVIGALLLGQGLQVG